MKEAKINQEGQRMAEDWKYFYEVEIEVIKFVWLTVMTDPTLERFLITKLWNLNCRVS